jgi:hypothetical protein
VEFGGEGAENPCHHDVVQSSPIDGQIDDVGEGMVIQGITMKLEKHEVTPLLVVGRRRFQNDHDHQSYALDDGSLYVQVHGEGGIRVGADIDRAIAIVILGDRDALGSYELLFQVTSGGLLLFPIDQGLACGSHASDESLLLSVCSIGRGMSHDHDVLLLPLNGRSGHDHLMLINGEAEGATQHGRKIVVIRGGGGGQR